MLAVALLALVVPLAAIGLYLRGAPAHERIKPNPTSATAPLAQTLQVMANERLASDQFAILDSRPRVSLRRNKNETIEQAVARLLATVREHEGVAIPAASSTNEKEARTWLVTMPPSAISRFLRTVAANSDETVPREEGTSMIEVEIVEEE